MYRRIRRLQACDGGFTLVEQVVALLIATIVFTSLAYALLGGLAQGSLAQQNQQAADLLNQSIERSRALSYDSLAMRPSDLNVSDPLNTGTCNCYNPTNDSKTGSGVEPLVLDPAGSVNPHVRVSTQNGRPFTLRSYVTMPTDSVGGAYKRLTVVVTWSSRGKSHTRVNSTLVAPTQRGLPLPDFKFTGSGSNLTQCRNPGDTLTYSFTVKNNGARDEWGITDASTSSGAP
ncbi:MAG: type IV pilus modification PilV family protein, partial [Actinomycetes bacterium]